MTTYRELLEQTKAEISELDARAAQELPDAVWIDVREADEWQEGHIPAARHVPRGFLESRIETTVPDKSAEVVLYCAAGNRSAFAAKTLEELGYTRVHSLIGGFTDWKRNGLEITLPRVLTPEKRTRYSRHILIPEIGEEGQLKLLDSRILLIGAGGLGSPASLYLAAAGVGTLGIIDADIVDETNLQRQIAHSLNTLGEPKVDSAKRTIQALNPDVEVKTYRERLTSENIDRILADGWDVIVDGADNFPTRYLVNDASIWHDIPVVHGSIYRFEGQVTVFKRAESGGAREVHASGTTVRELLEDLGSRLPALGTKVYAEGEIQPFVNVYVDGEDVRTRDGLETPVREGASVILLPAMAGGSITPPTGGRSRAAQPPSATAWPR